MNPVAEKLGKLGLPRPLSELAARDWDVVIVGGGPAGMACALRLAQLIDEHNASGVDEMLSKENIYVLEKSRDGRW